MPGHIEPIQPKELLRLWIVSGHLEAVEPPRLLALVVWVFADSRERPEVGFAVINIQVFQHPPFLVQSAVGYHGVPDLTAAMIASRHGDCSFGNVFGSDVAIDIESVHFAETLSDLLAPFIVPSPSIQH